MILVTTRMNFANIILSKTSQTQKATYLLQEFIYIKCPEQANLQRQKVDQQLLKTRQGEKWGMTANGYSLSLQGDEDVLESDSGDGCTTLSIY